MKCLPPEVNSSRTGRESLGYGPAPEPPRLTSSCRFLPHPKRGTPRQYRGSIGPGLSLDGSSQRSARSGVSPCSYARMLLSPTAFESVSADSESGLRAREQRQRGQICEQACRCAACGGPASAEQLG